VLVLICAVIVGFSGTPAAAYDYKVDDPYVATIVGTPEVLEWDKLPKKVDYELLGLKVFPDRPMPDVFWYQREFLYTLSYQKQAAPLIFVIAGTGSSFYATSMTFLQKAFWGAGFHVICLSSPTHMNFITMASATCVPGNIAEDSQDLYRVMTKAWEQVKDRIKVSEFYLTGYSLGASQAAFVSKHGQPVGQPVHLGQDPGRHAARDQSQSHPGDIRPLV
jgi:predicted alpha/beta-fold hydrolase